MKLKTTLHGFDTKVFIESHAEPLTRQKLFLWMDKMLFLMKLEKEVSKKEVIWYLEQIPNKWKHVMIGYEQDIYQAIL